jgi:hypothetical protein
MPPILSFRSRNSGSKNSPSPPYTKTYNHRKIIAAAVIADSKKLELRKGHDPKSGSTVSILGGAPPVLPISDAVLLRGMHE